MNINITGRKTIIKDQFREKAEKKLTKLDRFFNQDVSANIVVTNEGDRETVEVSIHDQSMVFRSEKTTNDRVRKSVV